MSFYIDSFMQGTSDSPSVATIILPDKQTVLKALLPADVSIQLTNRWGNLLPGTDMLAGLAQALGSVNIPNWIGASVQGWRGTDPIRFSLDMYLVNYKPHLGLENNLKRLAKLVTIAPSSREGFLANMTSQVHGGYETEAKAFAPNMQFIQKDPSTATKDDNFELSSDVAWNNQKALGAAVSSGMNFKGTLTIKIGNRFILPNLLITSLVITPSVVEVYSPSVGEKPKPLYYKINMGVMTCRVALTTDIDLMFKE